MTQLIVLFVLTAAAVAVALLLQRRRPEPPSAPSYRAPRQVDRADFDVAPDLAMIAVFTSATCGSCASVWQAVSGLAGAGLGIQQIEIQTTPDLHRRYKIDGVPTTIFVNAEGVVEDSFFGPIDPDRLEQAAEAIRGSSR